MARKKAWVSNSLSAAQPQARAGMQLLAWGTGWLCTGIRSVLNMMPAGCGGVWGRLCLHTSGRAAYLLYGCRRRQAPQAAAPLRAPRLWTASHGTCVQQRGRTGPTL